MHVAREIPTTDLSFTYSVRYSEFVDALFLRTALAENLLSVLGAAWVTRAGLEDAPGEVLAGADYFHAATDERLVRLDGGIAHLMLRERSLTVRAAAPDRPQAVKVLESVASLLPEVDTDDREVPVRFWWWQHHGARELARMLPAPPWRDIKPNYVATTQQELDRLMQWRERPPDGGRLLLWHGDPGTGKTSAVRSLTGEWRSWAEFHFVTDPEEFLENPSYLLTTVSEDRRSNVSGPANRWKVLVLEDAGEYLAPDAKRLQGQALSRLLNVCDGVLGQAMKALVLVTTNEPLRTLHPALARPGRCLADVAFEQFSRDEIQRWARTQSVEPPDVTAATLADLYAHLEGRPKGRSEPPAVGFAASL